MADNKGKKDKDDKKKGDKGAKNNDAKKGQGGATALKSKEQLKKEKEKRDKNLKPKNINAEMMVQYRELFDEFDEESEDCIPVDFLPILARKLELTPAQKELQELYEAFDIDGQIAFEGMTFKQMCCILDPLVPKIITEEEIRKAFKNMDDDGEGLIHVDQLRKWLRNDGGEPLKDDEFDALVEAAKPNDEGLVNYDAFVTRIIFD